MKGKYLASALTAALGVAPCLAHAQTEIPAPPPLSSYIATSPPEPGFLERSKEAMTFKGPTGIYVSGIIGKGSLNIGTVTRTGAVDPLALPITPSPSSFDNSVNLYGAAIGYKIPFLRVPSRVEVEYIYHSSLDYNPSINNFSAPPNFLPINVNSTFQNQLLMGNLYYDFDLGYRLVPYIGAGAGVGFNKFRGTVVDTSGFQLQEFNNSSTVFAWNVRAGARFHITPSAIIEGGYFIAPMQSKKLIWPLPPLLIGTQQLESNGATYASDFFLRLTWEFT